MAEEVCEHRMFPDLKDNRPLYSCPLGDLAFVWQRGWRWPCFDADLSAFVMYMRLVSIRTTWFTQQQQRGLYQNKVTSILTAIQRPGHRAGNCKMVYCTISMEAISSQWWLPVQFRPLRVRYSKDVNIQNSQLSFTEWLLDTLFEVK